MAYGSFIAESRKEWNRKGAEPSIDDLKLGSLQRIATALEGVNTQLAQLNNKLDCYRVKAALDGVAAFTKEVAREKRARRLAEAKKAKAAG